MKKDITFLPVEGIQIAIVRNTNELNQPEWHVVLLNRNEVAINNIFVTSKGYSNTESGTDSEQRTSTLRHFFAEIQPNAHVVVEPIMPDVFHLNNEYWVSYFIGSQIYDKKFIFVPDSIVEDNIIEIAPLGLEGVLHE
ncbi:hypothetical protein [Telluribacter humicola]|uniref:hypothetical protein n=1 Tax=Telluribacter humicola TaxID=1720261 RepID=UPI001A96E7B5|nr:hypothetical protein [Telluribacter humicola]